MRVNRVSKKYSTKRPVRAARRIRAEEEIMDEQATGGVEVAPEATDLLFEAEDVADLVAEVTGEDVAVEVSDDAVVFTVGEDEFTVEPEGDEEILESSHKALRGKRSVRASRRMPAKRASRPMRRR